MTPTVSIMRSRPAAKANQLRRRSAPRLAVQFAIDFAQRDLTKASRAELDRTAIQLADFAETPERRPSRVAVPHPPLTGADLRAVQASLARILRGITEGRHPNVALDLALTLHLYRLHDAPGVLGRDLYVHVEGKPLDRIVYRFVRFLEDFGLEKLRVCKRSDCGRLFFRITKKEYCSRRCQSRDYMRGYREENY